MMCSAACVADRFCNVGPMSKQPVLQMSSCNLCCRQALQRGPDELCSVHVICDATACVCMKRRSAAVMRACGVFT